MPNRTSERRRWKPNRGTMALLSVAAILTILAFLVGVSDNPPGIALLYSAGIALVLAGTHTWRNPMRFGALLLFSGIGFVLNVVIHNFSEVGAERIAHLPVLAGVLGTISILTFFLAVIVCPMGGLVGAVGGIITSITNLRRPA